MAVFKYQKHDNNILITPGVLRYHRYIPKPFLTTLHKKMYGIIFLIFQSATLRNLVYLTGLWWGKAEKTCFGRLSDSLIDGIEYSSPWTLFHLGLLVVYKWFL